MSMEESAKERATKELAIEARQALRQAYVPERGRVLSPVESALVTTCAKLCQAVEQSVDSSPLPLSVTLGTAEPSLDELYAKITGESASEPTQEDVRDYLETKFVISFPEVTLTLDEIWPDNNAPDNPTPEDVIEEMRGSDGSGHPMTVTPGWRLIDTLYVRHHNDTEGDEEVEWDGT